MREGPIRNGAALNWSAIGDGPTGLLFIHGWGLSGRYWDDFISHLDSNRWRAIMVDLPGHGLSAMVDELNFFDLAREIGAIATDAGAARFVVIGHSLGSKVAQYLAGAMPERIEGQILFGPLGPGRSPLPPELVRQLLDAHDNDPAWIRGMLDLLVVVRPKPELVDEWQESLLRTPRRVLELTHEKLIDADVTSVVRNTKAPTLAMIGAKDPMHTVEYTLRTVGAVIPHTEVVVLDCSHGIVIERPEEAARHCRAFLTRISSPGAHQDLDRMSQP